MALCVGWIAVTFAVALALCSDVAAKAMTYSSVVSTVALVAVVIIALHERQNLLLRRLYVASTTDPLTGLANRRAFASSLSLELERARRSDLDLSLVCLDLDNFKLCNDRHGHAVGDRVLKRFAGLLESYRRAGDIAARIGGEEFVLILFDTPARQAQRLAEDLGRMLLRDTAASEDPTRVTFSAGVASLRETGGDADLLTLADRALYAAKEAGRQRVAGWRDGSIELGAPAYGAAVSQPT